MFLYKEIIMADADLVEGKKLTITKEGEELTFYYADMSDNGKYLYDRLEIVNKDLQGSKFAYEVKSNELNVLSDYYLKALWAELDDKEKNEDESKINPPTTESGTNSNGDSNGA